MKAIDELARSDGLNETPRIEIKAYINEDFLYLDITDNGIGIAQKDSKLIFNAGYTTKELGTGLGLHSSANFVIGSGGAIHPLSDGIGKGRNDANYDAVLLNFAVGLHLNMSQGDFDGKRKNYNR